tara:strand:- start:728 stop:952 length:225 start_codon:yes stop_codon:yes gene_type:complete
MKPYLCIEDSKEVVGVSGLSKESKSRKSMYFVLKGDNWKSVSEHAKKLGAKVVRVLTDKEIASEAEDGSYDIEL